MRALDKVDALHKVLPQGVKLGHRSLQIRPDQTRPDQVMQLQDELAKLA